MPYKVVLGSVDGTSPAFAQAFSGPNTDAYALRIQDAAAGTIFFAQGGVSPVINAGAIANAATLTPNITSYSQIRVSPAGAVTGIIIAAGTFDGQEICVVNESAAANSVTFAAVGTSRVADGASNAIVGLTSRSFIWNSQSTPAAWYRNG